MECAEGFAELGNGPHGQDNGILPVNRTPLTFPFRVFAPANCANVRAAPVRTLVTKRRKRQRSFPKAHGLRQHNDVGFLCGHCMLRRNVLRKEYGRSSFGANDFPAEAVSCPRSGPSRFHTGDRAEGDHQRIEGGKTNGNSASLTHDKSNGRVGQARPGEKSRERTNASLDFRGETIDQMFHRAYVPGVQRQSQVHTESSRPQPCGKHRRATRYGMCGGWSGSAYCAQHHVSNQSPTSQ
ncbi:hypothetical protein Mp_3g23890 [Marchantia polymorpha subsp. ruderalis]|uniref:Uncharacterized protein n=2 Tax=Marchantia polymorpha TaxID=3197 RepID=A0AAF6B455_MARPO|nr:hypothetical protein MARPO_0121s0034 [Marchantia polymorpha]BBN06789.1 hypothetical protein Mp_3g23890 [Marchantia polymorpha subsp. ruderalis]|eukprot:PTQ30686.1 hypothetical protein MARPO_0121s0034 [Marchantia polymorpha]